MAFITRWLLPATFRNVAQKHQKHLPNYQADTKHSATQKRTRLNSFQNTTQKNHTTHLTSPAPTTRRVGSPSWKLPLLQWHSSVSHFCSREIAPGSVPHGVLVAITIGVACRTGVYCTMLRCNGHCTTCGKYGRRSGSWGSKQSPSVMIHHGGPCSCR
jgi:hypothetical protein